MTAIDSDELAGAIQTLAQTIAAAVVRELRQGEDSWIDQTASTLGARRHNAAVRRRLANGEAGAAIVGRRHFLSRDALAAELARRPARKLNSAPPSTTKPASFEDRFRRILREA